MEKELIEVAYNTVTKEWIIFGGEYGDDWIETNDLLAALKNPVPLNSFGPEQVLRMNLIVHVFECITDGFNVNIKHVGEKTHPNKILYGALDKRTDKEYLIPSDTNRVKNLKRVYIFENGMYFPFDIPIEAFSKLKFSK